MILEDLSDITGIDLVITTSTFKSTRVIGYIGPNGSGKSTRENTLV